MNEPNVNDIIPAAMQQATMAAITEDFKSTLKLPKKMNRHLVARAVDRCLLPTKEYPDGEPVELVKKKMGLAASELAYVGEVVAEFRAWKASKNSPTTVTTPTPTSSASETKVQEPTA